MVWRNQSGDHIASTLAWRTAIAGFLVLTTWNPSGYSYTTWFLKSFEEEASEGVRIFLLVAGLALFALWSVTLFKASKRLGIGAGIAGLLLLVLVYGAIIYVTGPDTVMAMNLLVWVALVVLSVLLGFVFSYGELKNLQRRLKPRTVRIL